MICFGHFTELLLGLVLLVGGVTVRVVFQGKLPVRLLERGFVRVAGDTQDAVIVLLSAHREVKRKQDRHNCEEPRPGDNGHLDA